MYSNCSLRAGETESQIDLRFARRENPICLSIRQTVQRLTQILILSNSLAIFCVVRRDHFNPVMGSPAVSCSNNCSICLIISETFFLPWAVPLPLLGCRPTRCLAPVFDGVLWLPYADQAPVTQQSSCHPRGQTGTWQHEM